MTGMLIDLKLVNHSPHKSPRILLTEPGWKFALLPKPLIDGPGRDSGCKFSADEIEFLMDHIAAAVPVENFAFKTTLLAIESGDDTPDALDSALKRYMPERKEKPFTDAFLTTQRAGVIREWRTSVSLRETVRDQTLATSQHPEASSSWMYYGYDARASE